MVETAQQSSFPRFGGREGWRCGSDRSALSRIRPQRMDRNTRNVVTISAAVILTGGRNLRALACVRDDNPLGAQRDTVFQGGEEISRTRRHESGFVARFAGPIWLLILALLQPIG